MSYFILATIIIIVAVISKKYGKDRLYELRDDKSIFHYFYPLALLLYDKLFKRWDKKRDDTVKQLKSLWQNNYYEYVAKRGGRMIIIVISVCVLAGFFDISYRREALDGFLKRPALGSEETVYKIKASDGESDYIIDAHITSEELTGEKVFEYMDMAYAEMLKKLKGNNKSLEEVKENLYFADSCLDGLVNVCFTSDNEELVDNYGNVYNKELLEDTWVKLNVKLGLKEYEALYDIDVCVCPYEYSDYELMKRDIEEAIKEANAASNDDKVKLPDTVNGKKVTYSNRDHNMAAIVFAFGIFAILLYFYMPDATLKKEIENRNRQMQIDYPEIVSKLSLLLGCGMTLTKALEKIVLDYKKSGKKRYAYEELFLTYNRMESGFAYISELEDLGNRCGLREYKRLISVLTRNMRKGNDGLIKKLDYEVYEAFENRKKLARILGEEASTKLLLPMIIMLILVMGIVVIPIFLNL